MRTRSILLAVGALALSACSAAVAGPPGQLPANGCPVAASSWVRWNDAYGLNVVGIVEAVPGWTFTLAPEATVISATPGESSEVRVVLLPRPMDPRHPPKTSDQHVYGYWPHSDLGVKPNWVDVQCGTLALQRFRWTPRDLFNPEPPEPPPTHPPPPPPRG